MSIWPACLGWIYPWCWLFAPPLLLTIYVTPAADHLRHPCCWPFTSPLLLTIYVTPAVDQLRHPCCWPLTTPLLLTIYVTPAADHLRHPCCWPFTSPLLLTNYVTPAADHLRHPCCWPFTSPLLLTFFTPHRHVWIYHRTLLYWYFYRVTWVTWNSKTFEVSHISLRNFQGYLEYSCMLKYDFYQISWKSVDNLRGNQRKTCAAG